VKPPPNSDGISVVPALFGRKQKSRQFLYWEFHEGGFKQAVRMGSWKAVRLSQGKPLELYDLRNDLGEQQDVASQHPQVVSRIEKYLATARTESPYWPPRQPQKQ
jgi:arylsulfatase A-like enzyme